jgi:hypothetical protein
LLTTELYAKHHQNYAKHARERVLILKNKLNPELKLALLSGELSARDFVSKEPHELESTETKKKMKEGYEWKMKS